MVTRVYRTRAYWLAVLLLILAIFNLPFEAVPAFSTIGSDIGYWGFFVLLFFLFIFIDSNVAVAREIDFFHTDILRWSRVRKPMFLALVIGSAVTLWASIALATPASSITSGLIIVGYFIVLGVIFAYSGATMFVISRRTYDQTMKKFVKMLGYALLCYVLFVTIWLPLDLLYANLGDIVTDFILIGAAYYFYRAAMSLTFVGRILKEAA